MSGTYGKVDQLWRENERLRKFNQQLLNVLKSLANEASGFVEMADVQVHGYTNIAVLRDRIAAARAVLAQED